MIVQRSTTLHGDEHPLSHAGAIGGRNIKVQLRDVITRAEDPDFFPPVNKLDHVHKTGTFLLFSGVTWEMFQSVNGSAMVPRMLTNFVREAHPDCTWQLAGMTLLAVVGPSLVAVIRTVGGDW